MQELFAKKIKKLAKFIQKNEGKNIEQLIELFLD